MLSVKTPCIFGLPVAARWCHRMVPLTQSSRTASASTFHSVVGTARWISGDHLHGDVVGAGVEVPRSRAGDLLGRAPRDDRVDQGVTGSVEVVVVPAEVAEAVGVRSGSARYVDM